MSLARQDNISDNEELVTSNEELQSTNEELHSVNEELRTVNTEYQRKVDELVQISHDMKNLQTSTQIGTLFMDRNLYIREFTPAVAKMFNLLPQDIGRPIEHLGYNIYLEPEVLTELASHVLNQETKIEREVHLKGRPI